MLAQVRGACRVLRFRECPHQPASQGCLGPHYQVRARLLSHTTLQHLVDWHGSGRDTQRTTPHLPVAARPCVLTAEVCHPIWCIALLSLAYSHHVSADRARHATHARAPRSWGLAAAPAPKHGPTPIPYGAPGEPFALLHSSLASLAACWSTHGPAMSSWSKSKGVTSIAAQDTSDSCR